MASRARAIDPTWPRCFSRTISCRFHNMYNKRPAANFVEVRASSCCGAGLRVCQGGAGEGLCGVAGLGTPAGWPKP